MKRPTFEDMMDLVATLQGIADLVPRRKGEWSPEMHVEKVDSDQIRLWFGPDPAVVYSMRVEVTES